MLVLLQGCCLQHEVLLLGCVHLMQVLGRHALRSVDGMLDNLLIHMTDTSSSSQQQLGSTDGSTLQQFFAACHWLPVSFRINFSVCF